jgi:epoxyqueuosine reductase
MQCLFMENTTIQKINYYKESLKEYKKIRNDNNNEKPRLLLHVCCGACSCYPLIFLHDLFDVTILFSNSNIYPYEEYLKRFNALKDYVAIIEKKLNTSIKVIEDTYNHENFICELASLKDEPEGGKRCHKCIRMRMERLFDYAQKNGYNLVTTVMSISRNKDAYYLNSLGKELENKHEGIKYFINDFKKSGGQDLGVELSKVFNVYRQDYCGCEFSLRREKNGRN